MLPEPMHFTDYQAAFAARIRNPKGAPRPPGASDQRMRVYQELLFNNLEGFLLACYPVTRKLLGKRLWTQTVRRFFSEHRSHSPLFRDIPKAFLDWMEIRAAELFPNLPFLAEFMHYEWLELSVSVTPDEIDPDAIDPHGDLLAGQPALNPTARLACYRYPVHRIGPRFKPSQPDGLTWCYLLHRDAEDNVRFTHLNVVTARLMEILRQRRPDDELRVPAQWRSFRGIARVFLAHNSRWARSSEQGKPSLRAR
ncbi:MAG: hypothetical protein B7Y51_11775 [Burkholderiales bacterium 28-67-8]|nr:MAG: hypothetical protein B7Y51_11775 [Burkholderiales bacterium 28-67-8]